MTGFKVFIVYFINSMVEEKRKRKNNFRTAFVLTIHFSAFASSHDTHACKEDSTILYQGLITCYLLFCLISSSPPPTATSGRGCHHPHLETRQARWKLSNQPKDLNSDILSCNTTPCTCRNPSGRDLRARGTAENVLQLTLLAVP